MMNCNRRGFSKWARDADRSRPALAADLGLRGAGSGEPRPLTFGERAAGYADAGNACRQTVAHSRDKRKSGTERHRWRPVHLVNARFGADYDGYHFHGVDAGHMLGCSRTPGVSGAQGPAPQLPVYPEVRLPRTRSRGAAGRPARRQGRPTEALQDAMRA